MLCGSDAGSPPVYFAPSDSVLLVQFVSDALIAETGFEASYEVVGSGTTAPLAPQTNQRALTRTPAFNAKGTRAWTTTRAYKTGRDGDRRSHARRARSGATTSSGEMI